MVQLYITTSKYFNQLVVRSGTSEGSTGFECATQL